MRVIVLLLLLALLPVSAPAAPAVTHGVTGYHGDPARLGNFITPGLTPDAARTLHRDDGFDAPLSGRIYAQPLLWRAPGSGRAELIVVTEADVVAALDPTTGKPVWTTTLGRPAPRSALRCGDIDPLGITGTPVIDPASGALYLDAMVMRDGTPHHLVFGLSLADGRVLPGWPIDVGAALGQRNIAFDPRIQNQRAALALLDGRIYVAFGAHSGDCGAFHGVIAAFATDRPRLAAAWRTRRAGGGIWAPNGIGVADGHVYFTTGNEEGGGDWGDGEAAFRLAPDLAPTTRPRDVFVPGNWKALDEADLDMSGTGPLPLDIDGAPRLLALGKDGLAYLLDRNDLGGFGGALTTMKVARSPIIGGAAAFPHGKREVVVFRAHGALCPDGRFDGGIAAIAIGKDDIRPLWCAPFNGRGSPAVTTTDGQADPIVWIPAPDGDRRLHGYDGLTGEELVSSAPLDPGIAPFQTVLPADGHLYVPIHGRLVAFSWKGG